MSDQTIAVGLACLWAIAGLAAIVIVTRAGLHILSDLRSQREDRRVTALHDAAVEARALAEDDEVARLDALYELPSFEEAA